MSDYFDVRDRLRQQYIAPREVAKATAEHLGENGFLTQVAGRVILTAPAATFETAAALPKELAERWQERARTGNQHYSWIQGRYVEAEKANRNGAFWSTDDLQFGSMSVAHGPLNWLHEEQTVIGTIADNALIQPIAQQASAGQVVKAEDLHRLGWSSTSTNVVMENAAHDTYRVLDKPMPRPYMAAVSAMWKWVHPGKVAAVETASEAGRLWYSMECIGREMACVSDDSRHGCGESFDYVRAMTEPTTCCEHIASRSSARRIVDPTFLGGAVIVPPSAPGWGDANAEIMHASWNLAAQAHTEAADMSDIEWVSLMKSVLEFAIH